MQKRYHTSGICLTTLMMISVLLTACYKKFDPSSYAPPVEIGGFTQTNQIAAGNLVAHWAFEGNLTDDVSKTTGVGSGTGFSAGIKGQGLRGADKSYALITPGNPLVQLQSFSAMLWINSPQNTKGVVGLLALNNNKNFWGNLEIFFENGGSKDTAVLKMHVTNDTKDAWLGVYYLRNVWDNWTHLGLTYNGADTFRVYVNGVAIATQAISGYGPVTFKNATRMVLGTMQFQTNPSLTTGGDAQSWASYLTGTLDEVRMYNRALTEKEINALVKLEGRGK
ncbi:LamG domain-containing protein [Chitinophaga nivalis]|uniref:LamG domain-containing protein n=1 Tax=Chitinophaga nivalis TaxID=2991709 RepID=A0ABT3INZ6_9BACT|nr:LamG domain-containing protein [Chitinophaga nivalis]MCW3464870.1 LamG domain-containing protein [Chitinophaga nivalis]MCW3485439.1 LamG domain-containing protein [Chitinophaga nivalis]